MLGRGTEKAIVCVFVPPGVFQKASGFFFSHLVSLWASEEHVCVTARAWYDFVSPSCPAGAAPPPPFCCCCFHHLPQPPGLKPVKICMLLFRCECGNKSVSINSDWRQSPTPSPRSPSCVCVRMLAQSSWLKQITPLAPQTSRDSWTFLSFGVVIVKPFLFADHNLFFPPKCTASYWKIPPLKTKRRIQHV